MQIAGQASQSNFRIKIKRDDDWFAASGVLKVDKILSLDMLQLIDLVAASPKRFIKLDDGRFLALTDRFRRQIKALSVYSDRAKGSLRFPPIRAAAMQELDENFSVTSDKHWQACVQRMKSANEISPAVPKTLNTDLRDYQSEGFTWLTRLSQWGAGACLADDMGLGKTIQAIALSLHRASGGPALVIAPTSVGFNWQSEIQKFAPALKPHLFGPGDRAETLNQLGPRDVVICSYGLLNSQFVDHLTILRDQLDRQGVAYQYLDGSTSAAKRKTSVEAFQAGEGDVFLISLKAGGVGLNRTSADYVIHMDPWWNPAVEDQASDRAHRLGQTRPVTIYRFITQGTIEERILKLHSSKRDLADRKVRDDYSTTPVSIKPLTSKGGPSSNSTH